MKMQNPQPTPTQIVWSLLLEHCVNRLKHNLMLVNTGYTDLNHQNVKSW